MVLKGGERNCRWGRWRGSWVKLYFRKEEFMVSGEVSRENLVVFNER